MIVLYYDKLIKNNNDYNPWFFTFKCKNHEIPLNNKRYTIILEY